MTDWKHCVTLTIPASKVDAALANFPVYVNLSAASGINAADLTAIFDELGAESLKIRVTTADGRTECYVEVVSWDRVAEVAELWVKIPDIRATEDTVLFFYFDVDHADNSAYVGVSGSVPAQNVWDTNFKLVCHMNDNPDTSSVMDSTSNDNDGTKTGANEPIEATGKIGEAQDFDGADDYINLGSPATLDDLTELTFSIWINRDVINARHMYASKAQWYFGVQASNKLEATIVYDGVVASSFSSLTLSASTDYFITVIYSESGDRKIYFYLNGTEIPAYDQQQASVGAKTSDAGSNLWIGNHVGGGICVDGLLDESSISNVVRSPAWVGASYETQRDQFISYGAFQHEPEYCTIDQIKERCLIALTDHTKDTPLGACCVEASRHVNELIRPYITVPEDGLPAESAEPFIFHQVPLTAAKIPDQIGHITADFGTAIFLRRYMPEKYAEEWWTVALGKMEEFIRSNWYQGAFSFV